MTASILAVWNAQKIVPLTEHRHHRHTPSPVAPDFQARAPATSISFGPTALAAGIERLFGRKVEILTPEGLESIRVPSIAESIREALTYG